MSNTPNKIFGFYVSIFMLVGLVIGGCNYPSQYDDGGRECSENASCARPFSDADRACLANLASVAPVDYEPGGIIIQFNDGTNLTDANRLLAQYLIPPILVLYSGNPVLVEVPVGSEKDAACTLENQSIVSSATLNYIRSQISY